MLLEVLGFIAAMIAVVLLPYLLLKHPTLRSAMFARLDGNGKHPRGLARKVTGLAGVAGLPMYGFAFPYAVLPAAAMIFVRPLAGWPAWSKTLAATGVAGVVALVISALYQNQAISGNILYYAAFALFVMAAVKMTNGEASAAQLLGFAAIGSGLFFILFWPANTDTFPHMWKYGIGPYVAIVCIWLLCSVTHRRVLPFIALIVVGSVSLFLGFRSHGVVCFISAVALLAQGRTRKRGCPSSACSLLAAHFWAFPAFCQRRLRLASLERLCGCARRLSLARTDLIFAGRVEPPLSLAAISEKWLFGWGNLNGIDYDTINRGSRIAYDLGLLPKDYMHLWVGLDGQISVHSLLGERWAEAGSSVPRCR